MFESVTAKELKDYFASIKDSIEVYRSDWDVVFRDIVSNRLPVYTFPEFLALIKMPVNSYDGKDFEFNSFVTGYAERMDNLHVHISTERRQCGKTYLLALYALYCSSKGKMVNHFNFNSHSQKFISDLCRKIVELNPEINFRASENLRFYLNKNSNGMVCIHRSVNLYDECYPSNEYELGSYRAISFKSVW